MRSIGTGHRYSRKNDWQRNQIYFISVWCFFTPPTENLPEDLIGFGRLEVTLPLTVPTLYEAQDVYAHRIPRLWVDLLQRATSKLRWRPFHPTEVTIVRYGSHLVPAVNLQPKALIDALKVQSGGRRDGMTLYYFGAVVEDDPASLRSVVHQKLVEKPSMASCRVIVSTIPRDEGPPFSHTQTAGSGMG